MKIIPKFPSQVFLPHFTEGEGNLLTLLVATLMSFLLNLICLIHCLKNGISGYNLNVPLLERCTLFYGALFVYSYFPNAIPG